MLAVPPGAVVRLRIGPSWPNPAALTVRFTIETPAGGPLTVRIVDVAGRLVRELQDGPMTAGTHPFKWSGVDDGGREVRPGLYFVRARAAGAEVSARIVRIR